MIFDHHALAQRVLFGAGLVEEHVRAGVVDLGAERVLLISTGSARSLGDRLVRTLPVIARVSDVRQHVPLEQGEVAVARAKDADVVVAVGGGSAIGLAKVVARDAGLPILAVPTTFSGSEATNVWGHTVGGRKVTGVDDRVLPRVVVYDVELVASLSASAAAVSALNALAHAVDGLWAPRADPLNRATGLDGARSLIAGLRALAEGTDTPAVRERLLLGGYLAATAFASAGSGLHHKICHVLGGAYDLPHAPTHAVLLPYVTAVNQSAVPELAGQIAELLGTRTAAEGLDDLRRSVGAPVSLRELGLDAAVLPDAAERILDVVPPSNPRRLDRSALERLLRAAWSGSRPDEAASV
ncbi:maleylacetate reductase [Microbacterium gorillae]|uniref:maleylacetate reductase n=1 Tax=Microbacterium gorillae TaxID=1231063 RepID=UPI00058F0D84|nr:maleylacetate reductase [Microbacterium gorillae]